MAQPEFDKNEVLETFLSSGWHGKKWPDKTYAILAPSAVARDIKIFESNGDGHAEVHLTTYLLDNLGSAVNGETKTITQRVYINYSPCSECSWEIQKLLHYAKQKYPYVDLQLHLIISSLYNIKRQSCKKRRLSCHHDLSVKESNDNADGLKLLGGAGVQLSTFTMDHWKDLSTLLLFQTNVKEENGRMARDLQEVLQPRQSSAPVKRQPSPTDTDPLGRAQSARCARR